MKDRRRIITSRTVIWQRPDMIARSCKGGHYALTAQFRLFRSYGGSIAGGASLRNRVGLR